MIEHELDNELVKLRGELELSQQALADAIGVSRKTIIMVETAQFIPSVVIALKLAAYFELTVEDIFALVITESEREEIAKVELT